MRLVAVALVSHERSQKPKALVRTEPSDAAIWLLPAFSGSLTLGASPREVAARSRTRQCRLAKPRTAPAIAPGRLREPRSPTLASLFATSWTALGGRYARCQRESSVVPVEGSGERRRWFARGPSGETPLELVQRIGDAYGLVLFLILTTFVVAMTCPRRVGRSGGRGRGRGLTAIIALTSSDVRLGRVRLAGAVALAAVLAAALAGVLSSDALLGVAFVVDSLLLAVAAIMILRRVVPYRAGRFPDDPRGDQRVHAAGPVVRFLFLALGRLVGGNVFTGVSNPPARDYLFFSYTTLTTTGYGNLVPAGKIGQILAVFEMLTGQVFMVTLVAGLVSLWRPGARAAERAAQRDEQEA